MPFERFSIHKWFMIMTAEIITLSVSERLHFWSQLVDELFVPACRQARRKMETWKMVLENVDAHFMVCFVHIKIDYKSSNQYGMTVSILCRPVGYTLRLSSIPWTEWGKIMYFTPDLWSRSHRPTSTRQQPTNDYEQNSNRPCAIMLSCTNSENTRTMVTVKGTKGRKREHRSWILWWFAFRSHMPAQNSFTHLWYYNKMLTSHHT